MLLTLLKVIHAHNNIRLKLKITTILDILPKLQLESK